MLVTGDAMSADAKIDDGRTALAWIRGFRRGTTNDPPDSCPDTLFHTDDSASYMDGWRLGKMIQEKTGIDNSSTLVVQGFPSGTPVQYARQIVGMEIDWKIIVPKMAPLRAAIGTSWWEIRIGDKSIAVYFNCNDIATISPSTTGGDFDLQELHGVGPFKP
jgi:hypothetical protein